jgi:hypothetical protein
MPGGTVTRSQTVHALESLFKIGPLTFFFLIPEKYTPEQGEFISSVQGTFNPEPSVFTRRGGPLNYIFVPSKLRTKYVLSYFTAIVPSVQLIVDETGIFGGTGEWDFEVGFFTLVRIAGLPYISSPVGSETVTLKVTETETAFFISPKRAVQISLVETITAVPGASIELELIPFVRVVSVIKKATTEGIALAIPIAELSGNRVSSTGVMVYEQSFNQKG